MIRFLLVFSIVIGAANSADRFEPGMLPKSWQSSGPTCPDGHDWQIHCYNPDFYILREPGCINYEKPFLYLIFGKSRVLLLDTGAGKVDTKKVVDRAMEEWSAAHAGKRPSLIVAHSHGHRDHTAADVQFQNQPNIEFVEPTPEAAQRAFHIEKWPEDIGSVDLGERVIDVVAIPGHQQASLAYYDARTGILLTGDSLYPGRLYVSNWQDFRASTHRLVEFTASHSISHILGCHIEQTRQPYLDYPVETIYQPDEHVLEMSRAELLELDAALTAIGETARREAYRDFTIWPVKR